MPAFVAALGASLSEHADEPPTWIPVDPDLTQPVPQAGMFTAVHRRSATRTRASNRSRRPVPHPHVRRGRCRCRRGPARRLRRPPRDRHATAPSPTHPGTLSVTVPECLDRARSTPSSGCPPGADSTRRRSPPAPRPAGTRTPTRARVSSSGSCSAGSADAGSAAPRVRGHAADGTDTDNDDYGDRRVQRVRGRWHHHRAGRPGHRQPAVVGAGPRRRSAPPPMTCSTPWMAGCERPLVAVSTWCKRLAWPVPALRSRKPRQRRRPSRGLRGRSVDPEAAGRALVERSRVDRSSTPPRGGATNASSSLNVRQRINANAVRAMASAPPGSWTGSCTLTPTRSCQLIDRAQLAALPASTAAVRLAPCEAVSQRTWPDDDVTLFKRLLTEPELAAPARSRRRSARPPTTCTSTAMWAARSPCGPPTTSGLGTHHVVNAEREKQPAFEAPVVEAPALRIARRQMSSSAKWTTLATSGGSAVTRGARADPAAAVRGLLELDFTSERRHDVMLDLFDRHVRDDVDLLDRLGLLVRLTPEDGHHRPAVPEGVVESLEALAQGMAGSAKSCFEPGGDVEAARALLTPTRRRFALRRS